MTFPATNHVFVENRDVGVWSGEDHNFYYFVGDPKTTTFRATITWPNGTQTKGILEQAAIRDE